MGLPKKSPGGEDESPAGGQPPLPSLEEVTPLHIAYVRSLVARFGVKPPHEREDVVQEALIEAHRSRHSRLEPRALLFGITRHMVFRWIAKKKNEREAMRLHEDSGEGDETQPTVEADWQAAERKLAVTTSIDELPPMFRDVFVGCEIDEKSMAEVSRDLGIPANTGYSRLHLARARFADAFRRYMARRRLTNDDLSAAPLAIVAAMQLESVAPKPIAAPTSGAWWGHCVGLGGKLLLAGSTAAGLWFFARTSRDIPFVASPPPPAAVALLPGAALPIETATATAEATAAPPPRPPAATTATARPQRTEGAWARGIVDLARNGNARAAAIEAAAFRKSHPKSPYLPMVDGASRVEPSQATSSPQPAPSPQPSPSLQPAPSPS